MLVRHLSPQTPEARNKCRDPGDGRKPRAMHGSRLTSPAPCSLPAIDRVANPGAANDNRALAPTTLLPRKAPLMDPARLNEIAACLDGIDQIRQQERQVFDAFMQLRQQTDQRISELTATIRALLATNDAQ